VNQPLNRYLDAAVLKPELTREEASAAIRECIELKTRTVCVRPCDLPLAGELCQGTDTDVCVVLAFPHGQQLSASKADEAARYLEVGTDEIDMVANIGWIRSGRWEEVRSDIAGVVAITREAEVPVKVIVESSLLTDEEIRAATRCVADAGADFVKTSTGFAGGGATEEAVRSMLEAAGGRILVKASGGIRDYSQARAFLDLGVSRLGVGSTSCRALITGGRAAGEGY